jgi:hypothetical protein
MWFYSRDTLYAVLGAIALAAVTKEMMSMGFSWPRPEGEGIVVYKQLDVSSFPSGHVYQIVVPWGVLYAREKLPFIIPALVAIGVSLGRLYLGVHFLGDVVAAIIVGAAAVWVFQRLWPPVSDWLYERSLWFYAGVCAAGIGGVVGSILLRFDNPRRWEILGMLIGISIALYVDYRALRHTEPSSRRQYALRFAIGIAGLVALLAVDRMLEQDPRLFQLGLLTVATLWTLLAAPALFEALWPGERGEESSPHTSGGGRDMPVSLRVLRDGTHDYKNAAPARRPARRFVF